jgi:hypothetical protein
MMQYGKKQIYIIGYKVYGDRKHRGKGLSLSDEKGAS